MSAFSDRFGFFDPKQEFSVTHGQLPHWEQAGATYFVTYRTIDSIPQDALRLWQREQEDTLARLGVCKNDASWQARFQQLDWDKKRAFHRQNATKLELLLDELSGKCELRDPAISQIVYENLRHFAGDRYELGGFVVMPNHVHVLFCLCDGIRLSDQCRNWKHYTSRRINERIGQRGSFWQSESFDHLVRDVEHFIKFRKYIVENPVKSRLKPHEYRLYVPELGIDDFAQ